MFLILTLSIPSIALSHGGRIDAEGGHYNRKAGEYHYHNSWQSKSAINEKSKKNERDYQEPWCNREGGKTEFVLKDETRIDCLTSEYAIEFDFGKKWAESIGQSLYYAMMTGKKPGVVLIVKKQNSRYVKRLMKVAEKYKIKVWVLDK
tara:strand:- start:1204 stop:1647 length:444 start_codon:yes stop_codon:yes gene_type:complete